jgi:RNA polymerase sigma-70 factor, ECF subfamily
VHRAAAQMSFGRGGRFTSRMPINRDNNAEIQDERRLLAAAQVGDERAFGRLATRHLPGLELYCLLMLGCPDDAHDAVHETLLRGWRWRDRVDPATTPRIWLYRLATDVCLEDLDTTDESRGPRPFDSAKDHDR